MGIDINDPLLQADIPYIEAMIQDGILRPMNKALFPGENGIQILRCGDGDQDGHLMATHRSFCDGRDCHHQYALNGLPLRILPTSPLYDSRFPTDMLICEEIIGACELKDLTESIAYYLHWPCGMGHKARLALREQMHIGALTKALLLDKLKESGHAEMVIVLGMHLDLFYKQRKLLFMRVRAYFSLRKYLNQH